MKHEKMSEGNSVIKISIKQYTADDSSISSDNEEDMLSMEIKIQCEKKAKLWYLGMGLYYAKKTGGLIKKDKK